MIDVKKELGLTDAYYRPSGFSRAQAKERREYVDQMREELDKFVPRVNDMDSGTRKLYNDLRGMLIYLYEVEGENVKVGA